MNGNLLHQIKAAERFLEFCGRWSIAGEAFPLLLDCNETLLVLRPTCGRCGQAFCGAERYVAEDVAKLSDEFFGRMVVDADLLAIEMHKQMVPGCDGVPACRRWQPTMDTRTHDEYERDSAELRRQHDDLIAATTDSCELPAALVGESLAPHGQETWRDREPLL